jgi:hypothetical protein
MGICLGVAVIGVPVSQAVLVQPARHQPTRNQRARSCNFHVPCTAQILGQRALAQVAQAGPTAYVEFTAPDWSSLPLTFAVRAFPAAPEYDDANLPRPPPSLLG